MRVTTVRPRLINLVRDARAFLLPAFQRPYCWKRGDRLALVESLLEGIPIGTILLWHQGTDLHVLDGQQRLTTLIRAMDPNEIDVKFRVYIDAYTGGITEMGARSMSLTDACSHDCFDVLRRIHAGPIDREMYRPIAHVRDTVKDVAITVQIIEGSEEFAARVYRRMNSTGRPVDLDVTRDFSGAGYTIGDAIERTRLDPTSRI